MSDDDLLNKFKNLYAPDAKHTFYYEDGSVSGEITTEDMVNACPLRNVQDKF